MNFKNIGAGCGLKAMCLGLRDGTAIVNTDYYLDRP